MISRPFLATLVAPVLCAFLFSGSLAANWKEYPGKPGQWINLDDVQRRGSTAEFEIVLHGDRTRSKDELLKAGNLMYGKIDCSTGQYRVVLPAFGNRERRAPDLPATDPLRL